MPPVALSSSSPTSSIILPNSNTLSGVLSSAADTADTSYRGYDHIHWWVGNAKQASTYYCALFGFRPLAYKGLETGSRGIASHAISNGEVIFVLTSPLRSPDALDLNDDDRRLIEEITCHLVAHGDAVKDVAFEVDDVRAVYSEAVRNGAGAVSPPKIIKDEDGEVVLATVRTYGDTTHTLVERRGYRGPFLPDYRPPTSQTARVILPEVKLDAIDHCVGNQDWGDMEEACD
jgi:4-hydroxyphenylpyruvate dioxygenase